MKKSFVHLEAYVLDSTHKRRRSKPLWSKKMNRNRKNTIVYANRNASIRAREDRTGKYRTETYNRDWDSTNFAVSTDPTSNSTSLFIDSVEGSLRLSGSEARTLYRLLNKHYAFTGKSQE